MIVISDLYSARNKYKVLIAKRKATDYTDKFENLLSAIIGILAIAGIFRNILQALS